MYTTYGPRAIFGPIRGVISSPVCTADTYSKAMSLFIDQQCSDKIENTTLPFDVLLLLLLCWCCTAIRHF